MRPGLRFALALPCLAIAACGAAPVAVDADHPIGSAAPSAAPASSPDAAAPTASSFAKFPGRPCKLPLPKRSDDVCGADADCGPSNPCHAPACVAKTKSRPPTQDTMCTQSLECDTADANRCGCLEGRCALIPPA